MRERRGSPRRDSAWLEVRPNYPLVAIGMAHWRPAELPASSHAPTTRLTSLECRCRPSAIHVRSELKCGHRAEAGGRLRPFDWLLLHFLGKTAGHGGGCGVDLTETRLQIVETEWWRLGRGPQSAPQLERAEDVFERGGRSTVRLGSSTEVEGRRQRRLSRPLSVRWPWPRRPAQRWRSRFANRPTPCSRPPWQGSQP